MVDTNQLLSNLPAGEDGHATQSCLPRGHGSSRSCLIFTAFPDQPASERERAKHSELLRVESANCAARTGFSLLLPTRRLYINTEPCKRLAPAARLHHCSAQPDR